MTSGSCSRAHRIGHFTHVPSSRSPLKDTPLESVKDALHKQAFELSGGQQQRLCIAPAIALQPDVLLLDEACSPIDPISSAKIEQTILELKADHTRVIVTHNLQQAARVSDYVGFVYLGELIEFGAADQMFTVPKHPRTQNFVIGRFGFLSQAACAAPILPRPPSNPARCRCTDM